MKYTKGQIYAILVLFLSACTEIGFKEAQPADGRILSAIPARLQGRYIMPDENSSSPSDTIIVTGTGYHVTYFSADDRLRSNHDAIDQGTISDSLVLKYYKPYYFLNFREQDQWMLRVIKVQANGDLVLLSPQQSDIDFKDYLKNLSAVVRIDSGFVNGKMLYQINPSPKKLVSLIETGFFTGTTLKRVIKQN
jgi:hypothetical protein